MVSKVASRILVMDDDTVVRTVVERLLAKSGHSVVGVSTGEAALSLYEEENKNGTPFALVIMDLTLPGGMGGKETVVKLRIIDPYAKVIVFSGYSDDPIMSNYRSFGFDGVISKPFSIEEFTGAINEVLKESA